MRNRLVVIISVILILVLLGVGSGALGLRLDRFTFSLPDKLSELLEKTPQVGEIKVVENGKVRVISEESVTIEVVKKVTPAVVTVGITKTQPIFAYPEFGFGPYGFFGIPRERGSRQIKQDIGSGFIVKENGVVLTNRHVVSDAQAQYRVITSANKSFDVEKIYRDPNNDLAILKINATNLPTVELGDSNSLQVGQFAIAIGTALGEFRSTVTTGVVSGLSRGITAGSPFVGAEKLENVIQTSAAINPGNSGGPLLNSSGQVIGVNVAVAAEAENIGFALPINLVKDLLTTFDSSGGTFPKRAFLGVQYQMVTRELAILNEIPEGAYVQEVLEDGPADRAGVKRGDIITKIDGKNIRDSDGGLAKIIAERKVGETVELTIYRDDGKTLTVRATLSEGQQ